MAFADKLRRTLGGSALAVLLLQGDRTPPRDTAQLDGSRGSNRVWQSEHFIYESRADDISVCFDVLKTLEAHRAAIFDFLGLNQSTKFEHVTKARTRYIKYRSSADLRRYSHCSEDSVACFFSKLGIETERRFETHELIHAYLAPMGDSHKLLEEGAAEALSCGVHYLPREDISPETAFSVAYWQASDRTSRVRLYRAGAWLVAHLLRHHGAEKFLRLYQAMTPETDSEKAALLFEQIYGETLEIVWSRVFSETDPSAGCLYASECRSPDLLAFPLNDWRSACDGSDVFRSLNSERPLTVLQHGSGVELRACSGEELPFQSALPGGQGSLRDNHAAYVLSPGRYAVSGTPGSAALEVLPRKFEAESQGPFGIGDACETVVELESKRGGELLFAPEIAAANGVVRWRDTAFERRLPVVVECSSALHLDACANCSVLSCHALCDSDVRVRSVVLPESGVVFRWYSDAKQKWFRVRGVGR